jgi:hypothetical protein
LPQNVVCTAGGLAHEVQCLLWKYEALSLIPLSKKKKNVDFSSANESQMEELFIYLHSFNKHLSRPHIRFRRYQNKYNYYLSSLTVPCWHMWSLGGGLWVLCPLRGSALFPSRGPQMPHF